MYEEIDNLFSVTEIKLFTLILGIYFDWWPHACRNVWAKTDRSLCLNCVYLCFMKRFDCLFALTRPGERFKHNAHLPYPDIPAMTCSWLNKNVITSLRVIYYYTHNVREKKHALKHLFLLQHHWHFAIIGRVSWSIKDTLSLF